MLYFRSTRGFDPSLLILFSHTRTHHVKLSAVHVTPDCEMSAGQLYFLHADSSVTEVRLSLVLVKGSDLAGAHHNERDISLLTALWQLLFFTR